MRVDVADVVRGELGILIAARITRKSAVAVFSGLGVM